MRFPNYFKICLPLLISFMLLLSGCTYQKRFLPVTHDNKASYEQVGLVVRTKSIAIQNDIDVGVLHSIGQGFSECAAFGTAGFAGIGVTIICLPINIPLNIAAGDKASKELEIVKKERGSIQANLTLPAMQQRMQTAALEYARDNMVAIRLIDEKMLEVEEGGIIDYRRLSSEDIDTVIVLEIVEISFDDVGVDTLPVFFTLKVKSSLIRSADGQLLDSSKKRIHSHIHPYKTWLADHAKLLNNEYNALLETVVSAIIDEYLLIYYPTLSPDLKDAKSSRESPYYVLEPYYPKPLFAYADIRNIYSEKYARVDNSDRRFVPIKEQRPLLQWEAFPWEHDLIPKERFTDIVYDLDIYHYEGDLAYQKSGLKENTHRVETVLPANRKYLWSVRARFLYDGKPRFTEWGGLYGMGYQYEHGYDYAWEFAERGQAWKFGDKADEPLDRKRYYFYPFMIVE